MKNLLILIVVALALAGGAYFSIGSISQVQENLKGGSEVHECEENNTCDHTE